MLRRTTAALFVGASLALVAPATASEIVRDCYDVGLDHSPSASVTIFPPSAHVDDGDPYVRRYPC